MLYVEQYHGRNDHFVIYLNENTRALQSYESLVAVWHMGQLYLGKHHDFSPMTVRYVLGFTCLNLPTRRKMLESGEIGKLGDLPENIKELLGIPCSPGEWD